MYDVVLIIAMIHGEGEVLVPAHLNFGKFILDRLRKVNQDDTCLYYCTSGEKLSYGEFTQHAVSVSAALTALGVARGDIVAVASEPRAAYVPTTLAIMLSGGVFIPIELDCGRAVLIHKLKLARPNYAICSRLFWEAFKDVLKGLDFIKTFICFDEIDDMELSVTTMASRHVDVTTFEPADVRGETDAATVLYSSGTTGMSKAVLLTHLNLIARNNVIPIKNRDVLCQKNCMLPNMMTGTILYYTYYFLTVGKAIFYADNIDLKTLQDYKVDTMCSFAVSIAEVANAKNAEEYDLSSLKFIYTGSGPLRSTTKEVILQRYPSTKLTQIYGTCEAGFIAYEEHTHVERAAKSSANRGIVLKVVNVETRAILGPNQRGEICVRTPCLMKGYLGATSPYLDEDGFYLTGDLGYYDDHKHIYIVDRLKDVICYMEFKTAPGEFEAVLLGHPAVLEVAVVGKPAGIHGSLPTAFVVLRPGAQATETELVDYMAQEVPWFMHLSGGVRFVSELPKNPNKKVERRRLMELLELEEPSTYLAVLGGGGAKKLGLD